MAGTDTLAAAAGLLPSAITVKTQKVKPGILKVKAITVWSATVGQSVSIDRLIAVEKERERHGALHKTGCTVCTCTDNHCQT